MERSPGIAARAACVLIACLLAIGCAKKPPPTNAAASGPQAAGAGQEHQGHHVVIRPVDPQETQETSPTTAAPPETELPLWPADPEPVDPEPPVAPLARSDDAALNPLRTEEPPLTLAPVPSDAKINPLRTIRSAHAFSAAPRAVSAVPRMAYPAGEVSPPAAAADPPASAAPDESFAEPASAFPDESATTAAPSPPLAPSLPPPIIRPSFSSSSLGDPFGGPLAGGAAPPQPIVSPATPASAPAAFDVVQVFYGTDRAAIEPPAGTLPEQASRFLPTAISVLLTLCLGLVAMAKRRPAMWLLVLAGICVSLGLGYQASAGTLSVVRRSGHLGPRYTSDRASSGQLQLGVCEVTIPKTHTVGELEAPSILRMEVRSDADKHVILRQTERLADESFYARLQERVAASPRKELFIFVHGFNVTFEDAARRTAQIHHDLHFEGAPVFFSWPAHDKFVLTYKADEANVSWSAAHLKQFLLDVTKNSQAQSINLIAHSMGNRALTAVLKELQLELRDESRLFNQVILAAPDIDADEFRRSIAPALTRTANRITLYASARDEALAASQLVHRGPRAGDAGRGLVVIPGIDTIDVTSIDTSLWGHTYYGSSDPVLRDMSLLLMQSAPPGQRLWLAPAELEGLPYWIFQPATATARVPGLDPR